MVPRNREDVQSGGVRSAPALLGVQLPADASQKWRFMAHRRRNLVLQQVGNIRGTPAVALTQSERPLVTRCESLVN